MGPALSLTHETEWLLTWQEGGGNEVISKERARQIERDLTSVALGRQQAGRVYARHSMVFEHLPDEARR